MAVSPKDYETRDEFNKALLETIDSYRLQIHTKAGAKYKVSADKALKVIENYLIKENDGVA